MLTHLTIRNFKRFEYAEIELGNPVVFVGPNNSGKTTALQALALWDIGLKRWMEKRAGKKAPEKRPGVTINRRDLIAVPVPDANLLWNGLHVRDVKKVGGKQQTRNVRVDIIVEGVTQGQEWKCGLEFDYANDESFYCRPLRRSEHSDADRMPIPNGVGDLAIAFLPPMSGLAANETRLDPGAIKVRLGEGRTAEVLRNLCFEVYSGRQGSSEWDYICERIEKLFGASLDPPNYIAERGEIVMTYKDQHGVRLDLSSAGRGLQQTLLLMSHLFNNQNSIVLIDEPDAHLEILRQRQIYDLLCEIARKQQSQVITASHSEIVLNEAADRDVVVAFIGKPHRIDDRGHQLLKSLKEIGFDQFYQAEQTGWVLYLEGSTDLAILRSFADLLGHPAGSALERPFVHYVSNQPSNARHHFFGLREAKTDLVGIAIFDNLDQQLQVHESLVEVMWRQREIENYLCSRDVLLAWARQTGGEQQGELFASSWADAMSKAIIKVQSAMEVLGKGSPWSRTAKVTDDFLDPLFGEFFQSLGLPNLFRKTDYHALAQYASVDELDSEICGVLDSIKKVSDRARSGSDAGN